VALIRSRMFDVDLFRLNAKKKILYICIWRVVVSGDKSSEEENMLIRNRKA
jgi:hypothetical protein